MTTEMLIPIIMGVIALCILLISLRLAYTLGLRNRERASGSRFDRLPARIQLDETEWLVEFIDIDSNGESRNMKGWIRFRQNGPRIVGNGEDETGRVWSAEGITFGNKLAYLYSDRNETGQTVGSVQVELSQDLSELNGIRSIWSARLNSLLMQPIKLIHVDSTTSFDEEPDAVEHVEMLTSGNERFSKASIHD